MVWKPLYSIIHIYITVIIGVDNCMYTTILNCYGYERRLIKKFNKDRCKTFHTLETRHRFPLNKVSTFYTIHRSSDIMWQKYDGGSTLHFNTPEFDK